MLSHSNQPGNGPWLADDVVQKKVERAAQGANEREGNGAQVGGGDHEHQEHRHHDLSGSAQPGDPRERDRERTPRSRLHPACYLEVTREVRGVQRKRGKNGKRCLAGERHKKSARVESGAEAITQSTEPGAIARRDDLPTLVRLRLCGILVKRPVRYPHQ